MDSGAWDRWVNLEGEWGEIKRVAENREKNRKTDGSHIPPEDLNADVVGVAGEAVYAEVLGYPFPTAGDPDNGCDYGGCNVKGTKYPKGKLITKESTRTWPAWFALCHIDIPNLRGRILGWVTAEELRNAPVKMLPGQTIRNHILHQDSLHGWNTSGSTEMEA